MSGPVSDNASLPSPAVVLPFALLGAGLVAAVLAGAHLPLITSDRRAVAALAILGWILCSIAGGPTIRTLGWGHPAVPAAIGMGLCALGLIVLVGLDRASVLRSAAAAVGVEASGDRIAFAGLAAIMAAKVMLGFVVRAASPPVR